MSYSARVTKDDHEPGAYSGKGRRTLALYLGFIALLAGVVAFQARGVLFYPPTARTRVSAAADGRLVYLAGGITPRGTYLDEVLYVDTGTLRMRRVARLPAPLIGCETVVVDGAAWVLGGYTGSRTVDSVLRLRPRGRAIEPVASLPGPRAFGAAAVAGHRIIYLGGWDGSRVLDEIVVFDTDTGGLTHAGRLPSPRQYAAAALFDGRLVVVGGEGEKGEPCPELLELDPSTLTVLRTARLAAPPAHPRLAVLGGRLVCYDGFAEDPRETLVVVDPATSRLSPVLDKPLPARDPNLALAAGADALYLVGGTDTRNPRQPAFLRVSMTADHGGSPGTAGAAVQALALRTFLLLR